MSYMFICNTYVYNITCTLLATHHSVWNFSNDSLCKFFIHTSVDNKKLQEILHNITKDILSNSLVQEYIN